MEAIHLCRICLGKRANKNISDLESENSQTSAEIMLFCLDIKIQNSSEVYTKLCLKCFKKISSFYDFKILALKSDAFLKTQVAVKEEDTFCDSVIYNNTKVYAKDQGLLLDDKIFIKTDSNIEESRDVLTCDNIIVKQEPVEIDIQEEAIEDNQSDDELLSGLKNIKHEIKPGNVDDTKENEINDEKTGKRKIKPRIPTKTGPVKGGQCEECGKTLCKLREHMKRHVPVGKRKKFACKLCDKTFLSYDGKYKHIRNKHQGLKKCVKKCCPICQKWIANLRLHNLTVHESASLPLGCPMCDRRFRTNSTLQLHIAVHSNERPYTCDTCQKKFRTKVYLVEHIQSVHEKEKTHLCQYCSKSFYRKNHLKIHIRSHTKEKPYKCEECGKTFSASTNLRDHRSIHDESKRFPCTECGKGFVSDKGRKAHMVTHTRERNFPCSYCGRMFLRSDHRNVHERTAHHRLMHSATELNKYFGSPATPEV